MFYCLTLSGIHLSLELVKDFVDSLHLEIIPMLADFLLSYIDDNFFGFELCYQIT